VIFRLALLCLADQPIGSRESIKVLRLIPNVRQATAFVAPPSIAAITAVSFSASISTGRRDPALLEFIHRGQ
jgi:hypothetical protein